MSTDGRGDAVNLWACMDGRWLITTTQADPLDNEMCLLFHSPTSLAQFVLCVLESGTAHSQRDMYQKAGTPLNDSFPLRTQ